jgi:uncharacterized protein YndB with AHSA1/START domain
VTEIPAVRREIVVAATPDVAFGVFVDRIGQWWPVDDHSVFGVGGRVSFEGDDIVEIAADGRRSVWGTVTAWEPGARIALTWHPGRAADQASHVTVTFQPDGPRTLVRLVHDGWEVFAHPAAARAEYDEGWPVVLGCYRDHAAQAAGSVSHP